MKKIILFIFILVMLVTSSSTLVANEAFIPDFTQSTNFKHSYEDLFDMDSTFTGVSNSQGKWTVTIDSKVQMNIPNQKYVSMSIQVFKLSDDRSSMVKLANFDTFTRLYPSKSEPKYIKDKLDNLDLGQYKVMYLASQENDLGYTSRGHKSLFFTISDRGLEREWRKGIFNQVNVNAISNVPEVECVANESQVDQGAVSIEKDLAIRGKWMTIDRNNKTVSVRSSKVEVWGKSCDNSWKMYSVTETNENGEFVSSAPQLAGIKLWRVRLSFENRYASVQDTNESVFGAQYHSVDLSKNSNIGSIVIPKNTFAQEASWLFLDSLKMRELVQKVQVPETQATIVYDPSLEYETGFLKKYNTVFIEPRYINSPNTALHELAHFTMSNLKNDWLPSNNCDSDIYTYKAASNAACAWVEGWSYFLSLVANNSSTYDATGNHGVLAFEVIRWNAESTSTFGPGGINVSGRITGALWDLYDKVVDGSDTRNYSFEQIFKAATYRNIKDFNDFWNNWKELGYPNSAKYSLHQNGILLDAEVPLKLTESQYINGEYYKIYTLRGNNYLVNIETKAYKQSSKTSLAIYSDVDFKQASYLQGKLVDDTYAKINNFNLALGSTYYLVVKNKDANQPVFAEIKMSLSSGDMISFYKLFPDSSIYINGQTVSTFQIVGLGETPVVRTDRYYEDSDTYIELFSDASLTLNKRIAFDDNSGGGMYSKIDKVYLNKGQKYYLRVTNKVQGKPVYAIVSYIPSISINTTLTNKK